MVTAATFVTPPLTPPYNPAVTAVSSKSIVTTLEETLVVIPVSPLNTNSSEPTVTSSLVSPSPRMPNVTEIAATLSCTMSRLAFSLVKVTKSFEAAVVAFAVILACKAVSSLVKAVTLVASLD